MKLKDLLAGVSTLDFAGNQTEEIKGLAYSSKEVQPGFLFAALKGEKKDGYSFIQEANKKGAVAFLSERERPQNFNKSWIQTADARLALALCSANFYAHPSQKMKVVGITGTKGKTTVTYLLEAILNKAGYAPGVIGTISYRGPGVKIKAQRTTPEAPDLQRILSQMVDGGTTHCLIEVSSHALELKRVVGIGFDVAVFTNLSGEHLDYHHSMDNYFAAKKKLFYLNKKKRMAVINIDDPWGQKLIEEVPTGVISYGLESKAVVQAQKYSLNDHGLKLQVKYPGGVRNLASPLLGLPNIYNILASVATALTLSIPLPAIQEGVSSLKGVPGRFEKIKNSRGLNIFVDYAHTDNALRNLLETIRKFNPPRIILVFGAGGDRDKTKRKRMGKVASQLADWTIITSDNPRSEDPLTIISEIEQGFTPAGVKKYEIEPDRRAAIRKALFMGEKGDYILVAGKGHEDYQIIGPKVIPFHDGQVIREILQEMESKNIG
ncbi:MAG: UDP-N-acetylmuramoyl-L-alanyl-D-glutamate--2,6-diaminopimelate ligase [Candidatus Aminicenantales bacterium]